ncbi:hypothetical protein CsSME_00009803 [Camellia sinensis var. sinensis]
MLEDVADLNLPECYGKVGVPRQLVVAEDPLSIPVNVTKAGLKLPLVAKPLFVDGSAKSHELFIAYDEYSLSKLEPPFVVQEFINHGILVAEMHEQPFFFYPIHSQNSIFLPESIFYLPPCRWCSL